MNHLNFILFYIIIKINNDHNAMSCSATGMRVKTAVLLLAPAALHPELAGSGVLLPPLPEPVLSVVLVVVTLVIVASLEAPVLIVMSPLSSLASSVVAVSEAVVVRRRMETKSRGCRLLSSKKLLLLRGHLRP